MLMFSDLQKTYNIKHKNIIKHTTEATGYAISLVFVYKNVRETS